MDVTPTGSPTKKMRLTQRQKQALMGMCRSTRAKAKVRSKEDHNKQRASGGELWQNAELEINDVKESRTANE
jgi:hypothetical protein